MYNPILEAGQNLATRNLAFSIEAGAIDALMIDLRSVAPEYNDDDRLALFDDMMIKVVRADQRGASTTLIDDVPASFFLHKAQLRGGFHSVNDGIIIPFQRLNITGNSELQVRISWPEADLTSVGGAARIDVFRLYRYTTQPEGAHVMVRARPLQNGSGQRVITTVPNVAECYILGGTVTKVDLHLDGQVHTMDEDILATLTHYDSSAVEEVPLVRIYAAGLLEQYSNRVVNFVLHTNGGHFVEVGTRPNATAILHDRPRFESRVREMIREIARENAEVAETIGPIKEAVDFIGGVKPPPASNPGFQAEPRGVSRLTVPPISKAAFGGA